jgi:hypothetical protein
MTSEAIQPQQQEEDNKQDNEDQQPSFIFFKNQEIPIFNYNAQTNQFSSTQLP